MRERVEPAAIAAELAFSLSRPVTTARVRAVAADGRLTVEGSEMGAGTARLAIASGYAPAVGDSVLVATDAGGARYVIGVLGALRALPAVEASDGSRATVTREAAAGAEAREVLRVTDGAGRVLFEHFPGERRSVVHAPEGDLEIAAAGQVRLRGASVAIEAADELGVSAKRAEVKLDEGRLTARATTAVIEHAAHTFATLETSVGRLIESAREAYRSCEGLAETRAGRLRLVAEKTLHALADGVLLKGREDVKVKAGKIYLG
jgi:hypothetical protein